MKTTDSSFEIIDPYDELTNYYKVSKFMNIKKGILELILPELLYTTGMTIAEYLIKCINSGYLRMDRTGLVQGMGEIWKFIPNKKHGPGVLVNVVSGTLLSVAELSDRVIDPEYNDWHVSTS